MKRSLVLLAVLLGAAAGAYAQAALTQEDPASNDVVQLNVLYHGSFCSGESGSYSEFYFRPTRELKDGWIEAEFNRFLTTAYRQSTFKPWPELQRLNVRRMCFVSVTTINK